MRLFSGALDADMGARAYSALAASASSPSCSRASRRSSPSSTARVTGGRVAVLAMGKLGSREMTAASDLDLIVIYDFAERCGGLGRAQAV